MPTTVTPSRRLLEELRAATLESRLEGLGVLRSFSRPRVSNDNPYSESLFRTMKYRPDYPRRPFTSAEEACLWIVWFVDWYNHRHRRSGIKLVTPNQRLGRHSLEICRYRSSSTSWPTSGIPGVSRDPSVVVGLYQKGSR
jgi:hypothetical protein